jgi:hypothetical protein
LPKGRPLSAETPWMKQIVDPCGLRAGGHWGVLAKGIDSSLLDYNRYIWEIILGMISLVLLKSDLGLV